jgi:hypothetical protein
MLSLSFQGMLSERYTYIRVGPKSFFFVERIGPKSCQTSFFLSKESVSKVEANFRRLFAYILNGTWQQVQEC